MLLLLRKYSSSFCDCGYWRLPSGIKFSISLKLLEGLHNAQLWSPILRIEFRVWVALQFWMQPRGWLLKMSSLIIGCLGAFSVAKWRRSAQHGCMCIDEGVEYPMSALAIGGLDLFSPQPRVR